MRLSSIRGKLRLLFLAFAFLVLISAGLTFWGINTQKQDALTINLAGRQRMLVQEMTRLALEIKLGGQGNYVGSLQEAANIFERTLGALAGGGQAPYLPGQTVTLPPTRNPQILAQLERLRSIWLDFENSLVTIQTSSASSPEFAVAIQGIEANSPQIIDEAETVVRLYEADATQKINRLRVIQAGFLISALLLLGMGVFVTQRSIIDPIKEFGITADRIGRGELDTPVNRVGPDEIKVVASSLESMRVQLQSSRQELLVWTDTLEKRVVQRTRELNALYDVSREISSRLDVQHVLHSVTGKARELLGAEVATLCLLDENGRVLKLNALSGPSEAVIGQQTGELEGLTAEVLASEQALKCGNELCKGGCGVLAPPFRTSHIAAPLRVGERVIGALCVGSMQKGTFSDEATNLLTKLANSAAIALENARLYSQAERVATLEERQRIATEMHDGLGQTLSYLGLTVDQVCELVDSGQDDSALSKLERARLEIDQAIHEAREAISSLMREVPPVLSLQDLLGSLAEEYKREGNLDLEFLTTVREPLIPPREKSEQVLRVTREALLNAQRHGQSSKITIKLRQFGEEAGLEINDDGKGFDPETRQTDGSRHFGLQIMRARAERLGGSLEVISRPGEGTQIILRWPVSQWAEEIEPEK